MTLNATPAVDSTFSGWRGCCFSKSATFTINLTANTTITANFLPQTTPGVTSDVEQRTRIGLFRPSTGQWFLDRNGNGILDDCTIDSCFDFGLSGDLPLVGDWDGAGADKIGVFRPSLGQWFLDLNANGKWDGSPKDTILGPFGSLGDRPVVGDWDGSGKTKIGVFRPRGSLSLL